MPRAPRQWAQCRSGHTQTPCSAFPQWKESWDVTDKPLRSQELHHAIFLPSEKQGRCVLGCRVLELQPHRFRSLPSFPTPQIPWSLLCRSKHCIAPSCYTLPAGQCCPTEPYWTLTSKFGRFFQPRRRETPTSTQAKTCLCRSHGNQRQFPNHCF